MWTAILLGLVIGLRHAVDPDHVVAVSGSGAVTVFAASALPTPAAALLYLAAFGLGTIVGMVLSPRWSARPSHSSAERRAWSAA
jgi:hypothetical protein